MVSLAVLIGLVLVINHISPKLGEAAAWMIVVGLLFPLFTFGGGTVLWTLVNMTTLGAHLTSTSWLWCCTGFGLPLACIVSWLVLRNEKKHVL